MKGQLLTFLLHQREELKNENIFMYLRLTVGGKMFVGFEYYYPYITWDGKPASSSYKRCNLNVSFDDITPKKYENFMKSYERILNEIREHQNSSKEELKSVELKFQAVLKNFEQ